MATDNGMEQVRQYAALMGKGLNPGDLVDIRTLGRAEVIEVLPDGVLKVRTASRCPVLVRALVCRKVR